VSGRATLSVSKGILHVGRDLVRDSYGRLFVIHGVCALERDRIGVVTQVDIFSDLLGH